MKILNLDFKLLFVSVLGVDNIVELAADLLPVFGRLWFG
jgi:hypothetical protein